MTIFASQVIVGIRYVDVALSFVMATAFGWIFTALMIRLGPRIGLLDLPSARKVHARPTPKGGGVAVVAAIVATSFLAPLAMPGSFRWLDYCPLFEDDMPHVSWLQYWSWLHVVVGTIGVIFLLGLIDDFRPLPWQLRLTVQILMAIILVHSFPETTPLVIEAVAVLWIVALTNAFNMLDNMDALSGGVGWIGTAWLLAGWACQGHFYAHFVGPEVWPFVILIGALTGFLRFNWSPARIFMGDAGSTFLGYVIAIGCLGLVRDPCPELPEWRWMVPLCICSVPIYDQLSVVLLRISQGRSPFHADKQHLSHRLVARGLSSRAAVGVIHLLALVSGGAGLVLYFVDGWFAAAFVFGAVAVFWIGLAIYEFAIWPSVSDAS